MNKIKELKKWIKDEICRYGHFDDVIHIIGASGSPEEEELIFELYTNNYKYHIRAVDRKNDNGYLGCTSSCRKQRPGESWFRGRDLPDGDFVKETWERIKNSIISFELQTINKPRKIRPDVCQEIIGEDKTC